MAKKFDMLDCINCLHCPEGYRNARKAVKDRCDVEYDTASFEESPYCGDCHTVPFGKDIRSFRVVPIPWSELKDG